jgi:hypothetical protein
MGSYAELLDFHAADTKVVSFKGACSQHNMTELNMQGSPLGAERLFTVMALVIFGDSLTTVNSQSVTEAQRNLAASLPPELGPLLQGGWLLKRTDPATLLHPDTRQRKTLYTSPARGPRAPRPHPAAPAPVTSEEIFEEVPVTIPLKYDDLRPSDVEFRPIKRSPVTVGSVETPPSRRSCIGSFCHHLQSPSAVRPSGRRTPPRLPTPAAHLRSQSNEE